MQTDNKKIKISISDVARTLNLPVSTVSSIKTRKSPADKYQKILECEQKLIEGLKKIQEEVLTDEKL